MGHVDHAHLPEDDRKSQRHENQNRTKRQSVEQILAHANPELVAVDLRDGCFVSLSRSQIKRAVFQQIL